jgi:APA family basic amino acid/polyamine antiporter
LIVFWAEEFDTLLSFTIFLDCFGMILSAASIFVIRKRTAQLNNTGIYMMKLYPLLPLIFIAAYTFVGVGLIKTQPKICIVGTTVLAAFIGIYFAIKAFKKEMN